MTQEKAAIFLTAYNEERAIGDILDRIGSVYDVYVVNDGSTDRTREICREKNARVITHVINLGQGNAVITMFKMMCLLDYDYVVHLDADGQHKPEDIPAFIQVFKETGADIVQGSRHMGHDYKGVPLARKMFLRPLTFILNKLTGYNLSDSMCGFRGYRVSSMREISFLFDDMLEAEYLASEMWLKFSYVGLKVENVAIHMSERKHGVSYKGLFRYGWGVLNTILRTKLELVKLNKKKSANHINAQTDQKTAG